MGLIWLKYFMINLIIVLTAGSIGIIGALYLVSKFGKIKQQRPASVQMDPVSVNFIGEQDGSRERMLKTELIKFFQSENIVKRTYLAQIDIG